MQQRLSETMSTTEGSFLMWSKELSQISGSSQLAMASRHLGATPPTPHARAHTQKNTHLNKVLRRVRECFSLFFLVIPIDWLNSVFWTLVSCLCLKNTSFHVNCKISWGVYPDLIIKIFKKEGPECKTHNKNLKVSINVSEAEPTNTTPVQNLDELLFLYFKHRQLTWGQIIT